MKGRELTYTETSVESFIIAKTNIQITITKDVEKSPPEISAEQKQGVDEEKKLAVKFLADLLDRYDREKGYGRIFAGYGFTLFSSNATTGFISVISDFLNKTKPDKKKRDDFFTDEETLELYKIICLSLSCDDDEVYNQEWPEKAKYKVQPKSKSLEIRNVLHDELLTTTAVKSEILADQSRSSKNDASDLEASHEVMFHH